MESDPLDQRLRQLTGELAAAAPSPPDLSKPAPSGHVGTGHSAGRGRVLAAAALVAVIGIVGAISLRTEDPDLVVIETDREVAASDGEATATPVDEKARVTVVDSIGTVLWTSGAEVPASIDPWLVDQVEAELLHQVVGLGDTIDERRAALANQQLVVQLGIDSELQARVRGAFTALPEELNAAAVSVDNATGQIISAVSRSRMSIGAAHPAGSARIAIYAQALNGDMTTETLVDGTGPCLIERNGALVSVQNFGHSGGSEAFLGMQAVRSSRCAEARLEAAMGDGAAVAMLESMTGASIEGSVSEGPALTAAEHAGAVVAAANNGSLPQLGLISQVQTADGRTLQRDSQHTQVMSVPAARALMEVMVAIVERGTGTRASLTATQAAGFTGTVPDFEAAWFVGTANGITTAVWLASSDGSPMTAVSGRNVTGGSFPAETWARINEVLVEVLPADGQPASGTGAVCPPAFSYGVDSDADGVIDTCYPTHSDLPGDSTSNQSPENPIYWGDGTTVAVDSVESYFDASFDGWRDLQLTLQASDMASNPYSGPPTTSLVELVRADGSVAAEIPLMFADGRWFLQSIASDVFTLDLSDRNRGVRGELIAHAAGTVQIDVVHPQNRTVTATATIQVSDAQIGMPIAVDVERYGQEVQARLIDTAGRLVGFSAFTINPAAPVAYRGLTNEAIFVSPVVRAPELIELLRADPRVVDYVSLHQWESAERLGAVVDPSDPLPDLDRVVTTVQLADATTDTQRTQFIDELVAAGLAGPTSATGSIPASTTLVPEQAVVDVIVVDELPPAIGCSPTDGPWHPNSVDASYPSPELALEATSEAIEGSFPVSETTRFMNSNGDIIGIALVREGSSYSFLLVLGLDQTPTGWAPTEWQIASCNYQPPNS